MKLSLALFTFALSIASFACEPFRVTQIYDTRLDSLNFVLIGTDLKGGISGEFLDKETIIRAPISEVRSVNLLYVNSETHEDILTTEHRIVINSTVKHEKSNLSVSQIYVVRNSWDQNCKQIINENTKSISSLDIMDKFSSNYITNHTTWMKSDGRVSYSLSKFGHTINAEKALLKVLESKNLEALKDDPTANYILSLEQVDDTLISCSIKGVLVSQNSSIGEKTTMDLPETKAFNCALAVKKLLLNTLPQN